MNQTLIILHGWGQNSSNWIEIKKLLEEKNINVNIYNLPGFGNEKLISADWGIPEYANWVREKIEALEVQNITLLGHSFGGRIASLIASENPTWLRELILYGAPCIYRPTVKIKIKILIAKIFKRLGLKRKSENQELLSADKAGLGKIFRKVVSFDQTEALKKINTPTHLIWGELDEAVPLKIAVEINKLISKSKLTILKNEGHNIHISKPGLFSGKILRIILNS